MTKLPLKSTEPRRRQTDKRQSWRTRLNEYLSVFPEASTQAQLKWLRRIVKDENFLDARERIRGQLDELLRSKDVHLISFFRHFAMITPLNANEAFVSVEAISNRNTRRVLESYIDFALRFLVYVRLQPSRKTGKSSRRVTFHGMPRPMCDRMKAIIGEHVYPDVERVFGEEEERWPYFNAPDLHLPDDIGRRLKELNSRSRDKRSGGAALPEALAPAHPSVSARLVKLRDEPQEKEGTALGSATPRRIATSNILHELEAWFYDPDCLTFLVHGDNAPTLLCLIGENIGKETWRDADKLITAIQREYFHRKQGGHKKDRKQLAAIEKQAASPEPQKGKVDSLGYHAAQSSQQSALSRARRQSRKRKNP